MSAELSWGDIVIQGVDTPAKPKTLPLRARSAPKASRPASAAEAKDFQLEAPEQGPQLRRQPKAPPEVAKGEPRTHALPNRESAPSVDNGALETMRRFRRTVLERVQAAKRAGWTPELYSERELRDIGLWLAAGYPAACATPYTRRSPTEACQFHGPRLEMAVDASESGGITWYLAPCPDCVWCAA